MDSLEISLIGKWEATITEAETAITEARYNLGRVALIYGGQLSLETLKDDIQNGTS